MNKLFLALVVCYIFICLIDLSNGGKHRSNNVRRHNRQLHQNQTSKLRPLELWNEVNDTIILNCSLKINRDHHVTIYLFFDSISSVNVFFMIKISFFRSFGIANMRIWAFMCSLFWATRSFLI